MFVFLLFFFVSFVAPQNVFLLPVRHAKHMKLISTKEIGYLRYFFKDKTNINLCWISEQSIPASKVASGSRINFLDLGSDPDPIPVHIGKKKKKNIELA